MSTADNDEEVEAAFRETFVGRPHDWHILENQSAYVITLLAKCTRCGTACKSELSWTQAFFAVQRSGILTQLEKELARYMYDTDIRRPCKPAVGQRP